eukprot:TRINITY_DN37947_c0_g1_i1.p2 TRINITY_DN37947_c0_g1~~TRINITY_DN37947_c0_g1_i1.p2  ORF type:complete len:133 (+),score=45.45 TRINITY_DN37947_c0_g1_i1:54-452(+)
MEQADPPVGGAQQEEGGEADPEQIRENLRSILEAQGVLGPVKAQLRAAVFKALEAQAATQRPEPVHETMLINELIREYLEYNGYRHTASTLCLEAGCPAQPFERGLLARQVNAEHAAGVDVPLLYSIVHCGS